MTKHMHLALLCAVAVIGLLMSPVMAVEAAPGEHLYRPFDKAQNRPDIDGNLIVWDDDRNGQKDIYLGTIEEFRSSLGGYTGERITYDSNSQEKPSISGDYIVWQDNRNGNWDIYLYERSTNTTTQLTTSTGKQWLPAIRGNYVTWYDDSSGRTNIVLYDIASGTVKDVIDCDAKTTIPYGSTEFKPALSEKYVAWVEKADERIRYYDIAAGEIAGPVSTSTATQTWPSLSGSIIAWEDYRNGYPADIYMVDLDDPSGEEQRITSDAEEQASPTISGSIIAWEDKRVPERSIFMYDLSTKEEMSVFLSIDGEDAHLYPVISGNTIVWQRGYSPNSNLYIFVYESGAPVDPALTTIEVTPSTATLEIDDTEQFSAIALDQFGDEISDVDIIWTSSNVTVGTIDDTGTFIARAAGTATVTASSDEISGTATVTVNAEEPAEPVLTTIEVTPTAVTLEVDETEQFSATTLDQFDDTMTGIAVTWASSNETVGTIGGTGLFTARAEGTTTVTASSGDIAGSAIVTVSAEDPIPTSIEVTPSSATLEIDEIEQFSATVLDQFGSAMTGVNVTWDSSNTTVGTIDDTGLFTALAAGTATVTASADNVSGTATVTVNAEEPGGPADPVVTTITVAPPTAALGVNETEQFTATVRDQFNSTMTGVDVTWASSNETVGTIDASGLFIAKAEGTTTVTAAAGEITGTATVTVTAQAPVLRTIEVTPAAAALEVGETRQFATACSDGFGNPMTGVVVAWSCSNGTVGTIGADGLFAALSAGTTTITAMAENVTGTATVTVIAEDPAPARIVVSPSAVTLAVDGTQVFNASVFDRSGNVMTGIEVAWTSGNDTVGTIDADGLFTALARGNTTVTATADGVAGTATVTVNCDDLVLTGIVVTPAAIALAGGETEPFTATALDQYGNTMTGVEIAWSCSDETVGTIDATGLFSALADGTATITAAAGGVTGTAEVTVATVSSGVVVSPSAVTLDAGDSRQFTATVYDQEGNATPGAVVTWSCDDETVGTIDANGLFSALAEGTTTVIATTENASGTATVTVRSTSPVLTRIVVSPPCLTIAAGNTLTLTATAYDQYCNEMPEVEVAWTTCDPAVGTIDDCGTFTALAAGTVTVTATADEISGSACVTVEPSPPVPTCIEIEPATATVRAGETQAFTARVFDQCDNIMDGVRVAWATCDPEVGTIDATGLFTASGAGTTTVTASAGCAGATAAVTVTAAPTPEEPTAEPTAEPTTEPTAEPTTPVPAGSGSSGGGDSGPTFDTGMHENLAAGQTFTFSSTISSVGNVSITAANTIPKLMLTVKETTPPSGTEPPTGDIYEYVEITLYWANPDDIGAATIEFTIPAAWLEEHGMSPEDVRLMRCVNTGWQILETVVLGEESGLYRFRATTPGFSTFAIAATPENVIASAAELNVTTEVTETPEVTEDVTTEATTVPATTPAAPLVYAPFLAPLAFLLWARRNR